MVLSKITLADLEFTRTLRNQFRQWFVTSEEITAEEHIAWFHRLQRRRDIDFQIVIVDGRRIGTLSMTEHEGGRFEIGNVAIDLTEQGQGYASMALRMLIGLGRHYVATILPHNRVSQRLFQSVGFHQISATKWELLPLAEER